MTTTRQSSAEVEEARSRWLQAGDTASKLAGELYQPGSGYGDGSGGGYGDSNAKAADEHRLQAARGDVERLFREYHDLDRRDIDRQMFELKRSQTLATWVSFAVAAAVGLATIASTVVALFK